VRVLRAAIIVALGIAASAGGARSEGAARAESSGWARELEKELMSPYCPGRSLPECPSQQAVEMRLWIQAQERAGATRESVEAELFRRFGDQLRHAPRAEGWGLWAYLVPGGAVLAGGALVLGFLRRQGGAAAAPPAPRGTGAPDPELERQLERELAES
jgi:cytochrome c-type biogenesis protein CcmH/NrfF